MSIVLSLSTGIVSSMVGSLLETYTRKTIKSREKSIHEDLVSDENDLYLTDREIKDLTVEEEIRIIEKTEIDIDIVRRELLRQAKWSFNTALFAIGIGLVLIILGGLFLYLGNISTSIFSIVIGAISEFSSLVLISFSDKSNKKLEEIKKDINRMENAKLGLELVNCISDGNEKDKALKTLIESISSNISNVA